MFLLLLFNFILQQPDTTHVYRQPEVVVTATRTPIDINDAPARVTQVDVDGMQQAGFSDTKSMLSFVDGVFIKDYGPAQISAISLRGTAAEQTLFLFDGVSLNNIQNGQVDLFLLPANNLKSIEISQGGSSALYGANAVGGVINLQSKTPLDNFIKIDLAGGSYSNQIMGAEISEGLLSARIDLMVQRKRGINNFDFTVNDGTRDFPMTYDGDDYVENTQSLKIALPSSTGVTSVFIQNVSADRGTPYALSDSAFDITAREIDRSTMAILKNAGKLGVFNYSASSGFVYSLLKYTDPSYASNDYYKTLSFQPSVQVSYLSEKNSSGKGGLSGTTGIDAELDRAQSDNMVGIKNRERVGIFASGEYDVRNGADLETRLFGAFRYDDYSQFGSSINPKAGINIRPLATFPLSLRANVGTSFRVPTFNDLYYSSTYYNGNQNLKPEKSTDFDLGAVVEIGQNSSPLFGDLDFDYYQIDTRDGIVLQELADFTSTEANLQKISSRGLELSMDINYESVLLLKANYFFGKSLNVSDPGTADYEKQLVYIPQQQSSLVAEVTPWILKFTAAIQYVGERFYLANNTASLPSYSAINIAASALIETGSFETLPEISIDDLSNRRYEVVYEYPMPGRTYRVGLGIQFNQDK